MDNLALVNINWKVSNKINVSIAAPIDILITLIIFKINWKDITMNNNIPLSSFVIFILLGLLLYFSIGYISNKLSHRKEFLNALASLEPLMNQDKESSFFKVFMNMGIKIPDNEALHLAKITLLQHYFYSFQKNVAGPYNFKQLEDDVNVLAKNIVGLSTSFKKHKDVWDMNHTKSLKEMISNYDDFISKMKDMCRIYHWRDDNFIHIGSILND